MQIQICLVEHLDAEGKSCMSTHPSKVFIDKDMPRDRQWFTMVHELGHLILKETGVSSSVLSSEWEEVLVSLMTSQLTEVLIDLLVIPALHGDISEWGTE